MPKDKIGDVKVMNNEYDNEKFFEEYAKMSRSKEGLKAAGEWHQLKPLFPSLEGKSVLDLGCGYGWHCKFAEEQGATKILGIDLRIFLSIALHCFTSIHFFQLFYYIHIFFFRKCSSSIL